MFFFEFLRLFIVSKCEVARSFKNFAEMLHMLLECHTSSRDLSGVISSSAKTHTFSVAVQTSEGQAQPSIM